jgi:hypothetical protein
MCARKEVTEFYQPLADLEAEFNDITARTKGAVNPMHVLAWPGVRAYYGLLENV